MVIKIIVGTLIGMVLGYVFHGNVSFLGVTEWFNPGEILFPPQGQGAFSALDRIILNSARNSILVWSIVGGIAGFALAFFSNRK